HRAARPQSDQVASGSNFMPAIVVPGDGELLPGAADGAPADGDVLPADALPVPPVPPADPVAAAFRVDSTLADAVPAARLVDFAAVARGFAPVVPRDVPARSEARLPADAPVPLRRCLRLPVTSSSSAASSNSSKPKVLM